MKLKKSGALLAIMLMVPPASQAGSFGDWFTGATDDGQLYAGSTNESGGMLMKGCRPSSGICYWYLVTSTACESGVSAPALFSTSEGAHSFNLRCDTAFKQGGQVLYRSVINDPDAMDQMLTSKTPLGIAIALKDGRFAVFRFSMAGAQRAVSILMQGAIKLNESNPRSTRDTTL
ncbi:hypothetical protein C2I33_19840 [Ralstonia solanacearum]|uniref:hypothetical protein n=1 Tax=Ralstonia solanacearum TaxID=305 RepID=UPI000181690E|nr:hypothetical protein [Ralstonia solanacearum]MDC6177369.1 hypothetical protein [Ralstonia solanacearum]MDC6240023.1 hypothetical protein [Ralstonia solanacearum]TYZ53314.1 hypothetical protein C2I33_19840 [Ralstonia solanacearum]